MDAGTGQLSLSGRSGHGARRRPAGRGLSGWHDRRPGRTDRWQFSNCSRATPTSASRCPRWPAAARSTRRPPTAAQHPQRAGRAAAPSRREALLARSPPRRYRRRRPPRLHRGRLRPDRPRRAGRRHRPAGERVADGRRSLVCVVRLGRSTSDARLRCTAATAARAAGRPGVHGLERPSHRRGVARPGRCRRDGGPGGRGTADHPTPGLRRDGELTEWHTLTRNNGPRSADVASPARNGPCCGRWRNSHWWSARWRRRRLPSGRLTAPVFGSDGEVSLVVTVSGMADRGPVDGAELAPRPAGGRRGRRADRGRQRPPARAPDLTSSPASRPSPTSTPASPSAGERPC